MKPVLLQASLIQKDEEMINHVWSVACKESVIDRDTNLVSIFNVVEELNIHKISDVDKIPEQIDQNRPEQGQPETTISLGFEIISLWVRSQVEVPGRGIARVYFISPDGKELNHLEMNIDLTTHERLRTRARFIMNMGALQSGIHHIKVKFKLQEAKSFREVAVIPIKVNFVDKL